MRWYWITAVMRDILQNRAFSMEYVARTYSLALSRRGSLDATSLKSARIGLRASSNLSMSPSSRSRWDVMSVTSIVRQTMCVAVNFVF